jgi:para-nitrobenzyl esterase
MKPTLTALVAATLLGAPALAQAPAAPAAAVATPAKYSVQTSTLGQLLADPAAKAIFEKDFPEVVHHPDLDQGLDLTLPEVVQYLPDVVTPEKMAAMDAELKALPQ